MSILALTSDTLIGTAAAGNIEYNGQFFGTDSNASRAQLQRIVLSTSQATTSGTAINFTGIPAWAEKITVMFSGVSASATSLIQVQLGDAGGIETTGYASGASRPSAVATSTTGFLIIFDTTNTHATSGILTIATLGSNSWVCSGTSYSETANTVHYFAGRKTLSDVLTQIRLTTVNGTDTFDAGSVNIIYEG